jgi:amidase
MFIAKRSLKFQGHPRDMDDPLGVYVPAGRLDRQDNDIGALANLTFAVKDLFDLEGVAKTCGCPAYAARFPDPATANAPAVATLLTAGARLTGRTVMDELAYSLTGANPHHGTPTNADAPGRTPGGSSSGSAAAVAGGLVDFALGTDTGGSVRVPASYCGVPGIRPSHGAVALSGAMALAPSFDTVGWFARDTEVLQAVGEHLLPLDTDGAEIGRLTVAADAWDLAEAATQQALKSWPERLRQRLTGGEAVRLAGDSGGLAAWRDAFRTVQAREAFAQHGAWIAESETLLGPELAERWAWVQTVTDADAEAAWATVRAAAWRVQSLTAAGGVIALPSAPGVAPPITGDADAWADHRARVLTLSCIASLSGCPQVSLPVATHGGLPLGLGLIGPRGGDRALLAFASRLLPANQERDPGAVFDEA